MRTLARQFAFRHFLLLMGGSALLWAQQDGGEAGSDVSVAVQVRVVTADDRAYSEPVLVRIVGVTIPGTLAQGTTGPEGIAQLMIPSRGSVRVEVSGAHIEAAASDAFFVGRYDRNTTQIVHVSLRANSSAASKSGLPVVAAAEDFAIPKSASKAFSAGIESLRRQDWSKAQEQFQRAIAVYPQFDRAYDHLGVAKQNGGDMAGAKAAYQKALELNDHNADAERNLARVLEGEKNWSDAEELLVRSLGIEPNNAGSLTLLSVAQLKQGKIDEAIASAGRVHALDHKSYATVHLVLAQAYELKGRSRDAIAEYQLFLSEEPNGPRSEAAKKRMAKLQATG